MKIAGEAGSNTSRGTGFQQRWRRPESEVRELMKLLRYYLRSETAELHKNNARLCVIGDRSGFDPDIVEWQASLTADNDGITVVIARIMAERHDIAQAARAVCPARDRGRTCAVCSEVEEAQFDAHLMTAGMPEHDLLIRTSGEQRLVTSFCGGALMQSFSSLIRCGLIFPRMILIRL